MTTVSIRGVSLFVNVIGHAFPLVLMHGRPGQDICVKNQGTNVSKYVLRCLSAK
jgi:hypothetical protein